MKLLYLITALLSFGVNDIAKINQLKTDAEKAYSAGEYGKALEIYQLLTDSLEVSSDEILLNMAHSHYHLGDTSNAQYTYQKLSDIDNKMVKSRALNQLGVISNKPGNEKLALNYFKEAIKADPTNEKARYNYEVLKKKMKDQQDQQDQDQQQDQKDKQDQDKKEDQEKEQKSQEEQNKEGEEQEDKKEGEQKEQQEQDQQGEQEKDGQEQEKEGEEKEGEEQEGEEKEGEEKEQEGKEGEEEKEGQENKQPKSTEQKLKELNISPQQAQMILEAMKNQEVQYLQQQRRKPTKKKKSGKPDW